MYQEKHRLKKTLSALAVIFVELALMAATTAVFVVVFERMDEMRLAAAAAAKNSSSAVITQEKLDDGDFSSSSGGAIQEFKQPDDWRLVLVNLDHELPQTYKADIVHKFNVDIDSRITDSYQKMREAALKDNIKLWISSGYRSYEKQRQLFSEEIQAFYKTGISREEAVSKAARSVARPGCSEHITGLAVDLNGVSENFGNTKEFTWLQQHAQDYGFVLRYPKDKQHTTKIKFEPWHYRYVGVEHAKKMKALNMCLEEYVDYYNKNQAVSH
ncbi:MAG: M15 family metallopeptidase [Clostridiales bacterium]|jgi:zinc D-Ala-D-Ala carboxypeptidase|nr:M15 family metallopeptidase [Clostridiales bacterium]